MRTTPYAPRNVSFRATFSEDDNAFLLALLDRHPEREDKIGPGVARFFVAPSVWGTRCFWIERTNGTRTEFSFKWCIDRPPHEIEVRAAMRELVKSQIFAVRDAAFLGRATVPCAITGEEIASKGAHVDHRPPATHQELVERFLRERGLSYEQVAIQPTRDGVAIRELADLALAAAWQGFHKEHAVLQVVSKRANLSQGSGRRVGAV